MPKKSSGKKAGGGGASQAVHLFSDKPPMTSSDFQSIADRWITIDLKLVTWAYLNFQIRVPSSTNLYIIEQRIKEQHCGSITKLQLWKTLVHPKNVLKDFSKTIAQEFGLGDGHQDDDRGDDRDKESDCVIFYDFHPHESDCPLLLRSPRHREDANASPKGR